MLKQLQIIADGSGSAKSFALLRSSLTESDGDVAKSIKKLKALRNALAGAPISTQIDRIINGSEYGKLEIRDRIKWLASLEHQPELASSAARELCHDVATLNAEIDSLYRRVNSD